MITDLFASLGLYLVGWFINLFPGLSGIDSLVIGKVVESFLAFREFVTPYNWLFPLDTLFTIFYLHITIMLLVNSIKFIRWVGSMLSAGIVK